jgi:hypothetical protein
MQPVTGWFEEVSAYRYHISIHQLFKGIGCLKPNFSIPNYRFQDQDFERVIGRGCPTVFQGVSRKRSIPSLPPSKYHCLKRGISIHPIT